MTELKKKLSDNYDYLTAREAADFCRISYYHFMRERSAAGIPCVYFMGKALFRKGDLVQAIERIS